MNRGGSQSVGLLIVRERGFTLVELCTAAAVLAIVLAAAYGWVWNVGTLSRATDDRAQALTLAGVLTRSVVKDVGGAVAVRAPAAGRDVATSLHLVRDPVGVAPEDVVIVWDAGRRVVWRNGSGTYVSDHVSGFHVSYVLDDGCSVAAGEVDPGGWDRVRAVRVALVVEVGTASVRRDACVEVGGA